MRDRAEHCLCGFGEFARFPRHRTLSHYVFLWSGAWIWLLKCPARHGTFPSTSRTIIIFVQPWGRNWATRVRYCIVSASSLCCIRPLETSVPNGRLSARTVPGCILVHSAGISDLTRERTITKKNRIFLSGALVLSLAFLWWGVRVSKRPKFSVQLRGDGIALSIAGTGDWLTRDAITRERADRSFAGISEIVKNASLGLTTLEEDLLDKESASTRGGSESPRWPHGTKRDAESLRRCGFTVVSLANNHAADYGIEGMRQTGEILDHEGIPHVGSGEDLQHANGQVYVGSKPSRGAVIAATTSAEPQSRATYTQGEILGRPGVNVLRYSPKVTVDPSTFATLKRSGIAVHSNASDPDQLILSGTVINKGSKTIVEFLANE